MCISYTKFRAKYSYLSFMGNNSFKFKQFTVFHDRCAMKVGTDGVLLGAWTDVNGCRSILDVGTGSGLIALMAAQRNGQAKITAIEMDVDAALQAKENVENSRFKERINVLPFSFRDFLLVAASRFDSIVSNPPFFFKSLPSPDLKRTGARHMDSLTPAELFEMSRKLLNDAGTLSLIYPFSERENIMTASKKENFHLSRETVVYPTRSASPKRVLLEFTVGKGDAPVRNELVIEEKRHVYTPEFVHLVQDFYLYL